MVLPNSSTYFGLKLLQWVGEVLNQICQRIGASNARAPFDHWVLYTLKFYAQYLGITVLILG